MANPEHLAILKQSVEAWNSWRRENPHTQPDLTDADLRDALLRGADLSHALLTGADLSGADLSGADLKRADLSDTDLSGTFLSGAFLSDAFLIYADLSFADLRDADLSRAYLANADLSRADLSRADLSDTDLNDADLSECRMDRSKLGKVDLAEVKGLETVLHEGPSTIGTDTLARTLRSSGGRFTAEQRVFFEGAGVAPLLLEYLPSILETAPLQFYSCFISYNTKDEAFATQLTEDLNAAGVRTWKWDMDARPGRHLRENIDVAIQSYDKLILVCSASSLTSMAVDREIETALQKEERLSNAASERAREALSKGEPQPYADTNVLVPIRLDDTVFDWASPLAPQVTRYYIPDFTDAESDNDKYKREIQRLIDALKPSTWPPSKPV